MNHSDSSKKWTTKEVGQVGQLVESLQGKKETLDEDK